MKCQIKVFPAYDGDCMIVNFEDEYKKTNILIDGGRGKLCYQMLKSHLKVIEENKENIDLLVITHIDRDHIDGIISLFKDKGVNKGLIKKVWFNSGNKLSSFFGNKYEEVRDISLKYGIEISIKQGITLEKELENHSLSSDEVIVAGDSYKVDETIKITILSPINDTLEKLNDNWEIEKGSLDTEISKKSDADDKVSIECLSLHTFEEDRSLPNASSIAFLLEFDQRKILMLGDSHPSIIRDSLVRLGYSKENKIIAEAVKISHHGSKYNTSSDLLDLIECHNFIISTNGLFHGLPHKECLSRIITSSKNTRLYFNYPVFNKLFSDQDIYKYNFECIHMGNKGYILEV